MNLQMDLDNGNGVLDNIKQLLDNELNDDEVAKFRYLLGRKHPHQLAIDTAARPSELIQFMENTMTLEEVLDTLEHTFKVMDHTVESQSESLKTIIKTNRRERQTFGCLSIVGREEETRRIVDSLTKGRCKAIWIYGMGGIGKTLLAKEVCYRLRGCLSIREINLKKVTRPTDLVLQILSNIGFYSTQTDLASLIKQLGECLNSFSEHRAETTCFVLDNIEDLHQHHKEDVIWILKECLKLSTRLPIQWIVTSRIAVTDECGLGVFQDKADTPDLIGLEEIELQPLKTGDALKLFIVSLKPVVLTDCRELLRLTNNIPLFIRLLSVNLREALLSDQYDCYHIEQPHIEQKMEDIRRMFQRAPEIKCFIKFALESLTEKYRNLTLMLTVVESCEFNIKLVTVVLDLSDKEAFILMMRLTNAQLVQIPNRYSDSDEIIYCFHPLIADILQKLREEKSQQFVEQFARARSNFRKFIYELIQPYMEQFDENFLQVSQFVSNNSSVLKLFMQIISSENTSEASERAVGLKNRHLSKLLETLQMTQDDKEELYSRIIARDGNDTNTIVHWKIEEIQNLTDLSKFLDAKERLDAVEEILSSRQNQRILTNSLIDTYLNAKFFFAKGRYLRRKEEKEPSSAIRNFETALKLLENCGTGFVADKAMVLDALGNAYFDQEDYDKALFYHTISMSTLQYHVGGKMHPYIALYEFNVGTVYLARAQREFCEEACATDYQEALSYFNASMEKDVAMGTNTLIQYSDKLRQRATALFGLQQYDNAISDLKESIHVKVAVLKRTETNAIKAHIQIGRDFIRWRRKLDGNSDRTRQLLSEAVTCFQDAESLIVDGGFLTGKDKETFIDEYRKLAHAGLPNKHKDRILEFCRDYELDSTQSSDDDLVLSERSSEGEEQDEGIGPDEDDCQAKDSDFVKQERQEQSQFEMEFFSMLEKSTKIDVARSRRKRSFSSSSD